jgi:L-fuculose-phosphate aldolase
MQVTQLEQANPSATMIPNLSPRAELALLARALYREGFDDHQLGHITYRQPDATLLTNPWGLGWDELRASDVVRIDLNGSVLEGESFATPAVALHLAYHDRHPETAVFLHHHPRFATVWAAVGRVPPVYDQTGAFIPDEDIAVFDDYVGTVAGEKAARVNAEAMGDAKCALLANHGVAVVGDTIRQAHFRALSLEWRCRRAWFVEALQGGLPMSSEGRQVLIDLARAHEFSFKNFWEYAVRRELRLDLDVLS